MPILLLGTIYITVRDAKTGNYISGAEVVTETRVIYYINEAHEDVNVTTFLTDDAGMVIFGVGSTHSGSKTYHKVAISKDGYVDQVINLPVWTTVGPDRYYTVYLQQLVSNVLSDGPGKANIAGHVKAFYPIPSNKKGAELITIKL